MLLSDDLLILELEKLTLLLVVCDLLAQALLEQVDLRLEKLNLLVLLELPLGEFFYSDAALSEFFLAGIVVKFNLSVLLLKVPELVLLDFGFVFEAGVLG